MEMVRAIAMCLMRLKKNPAFHVSLSFADRVLARIEKKEEQRDFRWLAVGILLLVIALIVVLALTKSFTTGIFSFISGYPGLIIFGIAFVLLLQWVDRKLIRKEKGLV
jgi:undecaprenyl pyrophosphate phosphatase UppP